MAFIVPRDYKYYYQKGYEAIEQGNNAAAIYYLDSAVILNPEADSTYTLLASCYYNLGKVEKTIDYSNKAIFINPNNPYGYFYRGISTSFVDVFSDSLAKQIKKHKKDSVWLADNIKNRYYMPSTNDYSYSGLYDYGNAIEDLTKCIELDSTFITAYSYRAIYYHYLQQVDAAEKDYDYCIKKEPKVATHYLNRGNFREQYGSPGHARDDYTKGIDLDSNMAELYEKRGLLYYNAFHDKEYACKDLTKATLLGRYIEDLDSYCKLTDLESTMRMYGGYPHRHDYQYCVCPPKPVFNPETDTIREIEISPDNVMEIWDIKDSEKTTWKFDDGRVIEISKETKKRWLKEEEEKRKKELLNTP